MLASLLLAAAAATAISMPDAFDRSQLETQATGKGWEAVGAGRSLTPS